ncbi:hypothetical protein OSTOST_20646, partial [Ostertagia ostertagi]
AAGYYHPDAVLVQKGKNAVYGRAAIKQELLTRRHAGQSNNEEKRPFQLIDDKYQMAPDYIVVTAGYETTSAKIGVVSGNFTQIWKKSGNSYLIYHDEYEMK